MQSRFLVCAYACSPYRGSEPGVGWGWINMIARFGETWVLTDADNREEIERETSRDRARYNNLHFVYVPRTRWLKAEKVWPPAYLWTYRLWQREAYKAACELHDKIKFSLVHVVTYVGFRVPGPFWKMDIPLVWGPIGGLENTPWRLLPAMGVRGATHYGCRNVINTAAQAFTARAEECVRKSARLDHRGNQRNPARDRTLVRREERRDLRSRRARCRR